MLKHVLVWKVSPSPSPRNGSLPKWDNLEGARLGSLLRCKTVQKSNGENLQPKPKAIVSRCCWRLPDEDALDSSAVNRKKKNPIKTSPLTENRSLNHWIAHPTPYRCVVLARSQIDDFSLCQRRLCVLCSDPRWPYCCLGANLRWFLVCCISRRVGNYNQNILMKTKSIFHSVAADFCALFARVSLYNAAQTRPGQRGEEARVDCLALKCKWKYYLINSDGRGVGFRLFFSEHLAVRVILHTLSRAVDRAYVETLCEVITIWKDFFYLYLVFIFKRT